MSNRKCAAEIRAINESLNNYEHLLRWYARAKALARAEERPQPTEKPPPRKTEVLSPPLEVVDLPAVDYYRLSDAARWFLTRNRPLRRRRVREATLTRQAIKRRGQ